MNYRVMMAMLAGALVVSAGCVHAGGIRVLFNEKGPSASSNYTIKRFNSAHPEIAVTPVYMKGQLGERIVKERCDAYFGDPWVVQEAMEAGLADNLYPFLPKAVTDNIPLNLLTPYVVNKKLYALPTGGLAQSLAFNRTMFHDAGVPVPDYTWTWKDDVFKASCKISSDTDGDGKMDKYGLSFLTGYGEEYVTVIQSYGGKVMDSGKKAKAYTAKPALEAIKLLLDMASLQGLCFSTDWNLNSVTGHPFYTGNAAMRLMWNGREDWRQKGFDERGIKVRVGLTSTPRGPIGSVPLVDCTTACMFRSGANKRDAATFLQYFVDPGVQLAYMSEGVLPTNLQALLSNKVLDSMPSWYINSFKNGRARSRDPKYDIIERAMWDDFYEVARGRMPLGELIARGSK